LLSFSTGVRFIGRLMLPSACQDYAVNETRSRSGSWSALAYWNRKLILAKLNHFLNVL